MRTKEELIDMVKQIDNGIGVVKDKKDIEYFNDVKAFLGWILEKISAGEEVPNIEEKIRYVVDHSSVDELGKDEIKTLTVFMNKEFERYFKITNTLRLETVACNISDAWWWVSGELSTKKFLSDSFLRLK